MQNKGGQNHDWHFELKNRIRTITELEASIKLTDEEKENFEKVSNNFKFAITPYYLSLIKNENYKIRKMIMPNILELSELKSEYIDPLAEEKNMPVKGLIHRYENRALIYLTHDCPSFCRYCTRKRLVGRAETKISKSDIDNICKYINEHKEIYDVIISGGDPLTESDEHIDYVLTKIREISHVEIIRIATKTLVTMPMRINKNLCDILKKHKPVYVQTHFNTLEECTAEAHKASEMLADAGVVVNNQMVILKGVNDTGEEVHRLNRELMKMRIRPYFISQCDQISGINHFKTKISVGLEIIEYLRAHSSGISIPHFIVDLPRGGGKIFLSPEYIVKKENNKIFFRNSQNKIYEFED